MLKSSGDLETTIQIGWNLEISSSTIIIFNHIQQLIVEVQMIN